MSMIAAMKAEAPMMKGLRRPTRSESLPAMSIMISWPGGAAEGRPAKASLASEADRAGWMWDWRM